MISPVFKAQKISFFLVELENSSKHSLTIQIVLHLLRSYNAGKSLENGYTKNVQSLYNKKHTKNFAEFVWINHSELIDKCLCYGQQKSIFQGIEHFREKGCKVSAKTVIEN